MKTIRSVVVAPACLLCLALSATAQADYQIQVWTGSTTGWQTYDPQSGNSDVTHEVPAGELKDERPANDDDYFEWTQKDQYDGNTLKTFRIKKNKIPKESTRQQMQDAADKDTKIKITMDKDGKMTETRTDKNT